MEIKENSNLSDLIGNSLKSLKDLSDSETIIGSPITTASGTTVIPVSKLSMGFVGGGLDYGKKLKAKPDLKEYSEGKPNFGGGGGTGISLVPVAFLVIEPDGKVSVLPIAGSNASSGDALSTLLEKLPEIASKIKSKFDKRKQKKAEDKDEEEDVDVETGTESQTEEEGTATSE